MKSKNKFLELNGLRREVGLVPAIMLVIGNTIGTGIFTTSGFIVKELRDPLGLILVWLLGGVISLFGALCYAEFGKMFPRAGGEYVFLKESFGKAFGFLAGWISLLVGFSAPIAATTIAFSKHLLEIVKIEDLIFVFVLKVDQYPLLTLSLINLLSILTILALSFVHLQRIRIGANFQTGITAFKILFLLFFIILGFFFSDKGLELSSPKSLLEFDSFKKIIFNVGLPVSLIYVMYAYSGWNAVIYIGEEIKDPQKNIPFSLILGTLTVIGLYLGLNLLYITIFSVEEMNGVLEIGAKTAEKAFGEKIGLFFKCGITLGLVSVLSAMILAGPRVYYAMARDGVFFKIFSKINPATGIPEFSIFLQAGIAILMILTSSFEALLLYVGFTLSLCSTLVIVGLMKLKKRLILTGVLYILANLWMVILTTVDKPLTVLAGCLTIGSGLLIYLILFRKS